MFNPAYPFTADLLESFLNKEVFYFVRSNYPRGVAGDIRQATLITHYHDQSEAERHYNVIQHDRQREIYDIRKPADLEKLKEETVPNEQYKAFSKLILPDAEKKANAHFKEHTKRFLFKNTNWDLKGAVTIYPKFRYQLGELYVRIHHKGDEIIIKFEEIEKA